MGKNKNWILGSISLLIILGLTFFFWHNNFNFNKTGNIILNKTQQNSSSNSYQSINSAITNSDIYAMYKGGSGPYLGYVTLQAPSCFWSGTKVVCNGKITDTSKLPIPEIYVYLTASNKESACDYCSSNRESLGPFNSGDTKEYTLSCEVGKETNIIVYVYTSDAAQDGTTASTTNGNCN